MRTSSACNKLALLIGVLALVGGVFYFLAVTPSPARGWIRHDIGEEVFGSEENLKLFATSEALAARRLTSIDGGGGYVLEDYKKGEEVVISQASMDMIRNLVQQESSYKWNDMSMCIPDYGVLLSAYGQREKEIHVALCFKCRQLSVFEGGEVVSTTSFSNMDRRMAALIKPLFPDDDEIQALP